MTHRDRTLRLWLAWVAGLFGLAAALALALSFLYTPEAMASGAPLAAVGLEATGCPGCPLCGLSRACAGTRECSRQRPASSTASEQKPRAPAP